MVSRCSGGQHLPSCTDCLVSQSLNSTTSGLALCWPCDSRNWRNHSCRLAIPWLALAPLVRPNRPSVLQLPEWLQIQRIPTVTRTDLDMCMFGDLPHRPPTMTFARGTSVVANFDPGGLYRRCSHSVATWRSPFSVKAATRDVQSPHPPLVGRRLYSLVVDGTQQIPAADAG